VWLVIDHIGNPVTDNWSAGVSMNVSEQPPHSSETLLLVLNRPEDVFFKESLSSKKESPLKFKLSAF
jgi:hypothetical protein